jgi:hypothetical protein
MRSNMDPLAPATITLAPAVAHIAETAVGLAGELGTADSNEKSKAEQKKRNQRELIQKALQGPETLQSLLNKNRRDEAVAEWKIIQEILDRCGKLKGVQELRDQCEQIITDDDGD